MDSDQSPGATKTLHGQLAAIVEQVRSNEQNYQAEIEDLRIQNSLLHEASATMYNLREELKKYKTMSKDLQEDNKNLRKQIEKQTTATANARTEGSQELADHRHLHQNLQQMLARFAAKQRIRTRSALNSQVDFQQPREAHDNANGVTSTTGSLFYDSFGKGTTKEFGSPANVLEEDTSYKDDFHSFLLNLETMIVEKRQQLNSIVPESPKEKMIVGSGPHAVLRFRKRISARDKEIQNLRQDVNGLIDTINESVVASIQKLETVDITVNDTESRTLSDAASITPETPIDAGSGATANQPLTLWKKVLTPPLQDEEESMAPSAKEARTQ